MIAPFMSMPIPFFVASGLGAAAGFWILRFFRDFQPHPNALPDQILSPAHGVVDVVAFCDPPRGLPGEWQRISMYLSLRDLHVQHSPMTGRVAECNHVAGKLSRAIEKNCGMHNEHLWLLIEDPAAPERRAALRLIAGIWVRRIVPWVSPGQEVARSERISLIRFGSRTDVFLPTSARVEVKVGDRVVGGETPLARWPQQSFAMF